MDKNYVNKRLSELGIYNDYYYRRELKALPQVLKDGEQINCVFTGVHDANRKMVVITDKRLIIIFAPTMGGGQIQSIGLGVVTGSVFEKKFLFSRVTFTAEKKEYLFTAVQGARKGLFEQAMNNN